jgi:argininosuccinate lyase
VKVLPSKGNQNTLFEFTQGVDVDARLAAQEVQVQKAWAKALSKKGILKIGETESLTQALDDALNLIETGKFDWKIEDEDIHMNLERFLTERLGELGKRIHIGRSRNDLIATTLRLFVSHSLGEVTRWTGDLIDSILNKSKQWEDVLVPGMTHLQNGQPIRLGAVLSSHGWALFRDMQRLKAAQTRALAVMPLGSAALAGTTLDMDLGDLATALGFSLPPQNSYDSVGDRDFMIEALDALASIGVHLSRISEDFIVWSSGYAGLIRLSPAWSTGSSIMPNKRNPDVPELVRAKSSHLIGAASQAHLLMKGLPSSYVSDLHELKKVYLGAFTEAEKCLKILVPFTRELAVDTAKAKELLQSGHILATDIANQLTLEGVPFRDAYAKVAELVEKASRAGVSVEKVFESPSIGFEASVEARNSSGGTALSSLRAGIENLKKLKKEI